MRAHALTLGIALAVLGASGCIFQNVSPIERLRDSVIGYNEEVRWGRTDLAIQRVEPEFRPRFVISHRSWGRDVQIGDMDIMNVQVAGEERESAESVVLYRWYDQRTMLLADTTVRQVWEKGVNEYTLVSEQIIAGDPSLLEIPEEFRDALEAEETAIAEARRAREAAEAAERGEEPEADEDEAELERRRATVHAADIAASEH